MDGIVDGIMTDTAATSGVVAPSRTFAAKPPETVPLIRPSRYVGSGWTEPIGSG